MEQLIYVSTADRGLDGGGVFDIVHHSSSRNSERGITGFLIFAKGLFLQYIEGPTAALDALMADLGRDSRHHSITIIDRRACDKRAFATWTMKRVNPAVDAGPAQELLGKLPGLNVPADAVQQIKGLLAL